MPRAGRKQQNQEEGRHLVEDEDEQSAHAQGNQPKETRANNAQTSAEVLDCHTEDQTVTIERA